MTGSGTETYRCDFCRDYPVELRPVCVEGREEIPLLCSDCTLAIDVAGRFDKDRDADEFGYSEEHLARRIA